MLPNANQPASQRIPVLLIDDNEDHQRLIISHLKGASLRVNVLAVSTAGEALSYLRQRYIECSPLPQLILLDLHLPDDQTGWQLLQAIRDSYPLLTVVVISYDQSPTTVLRAYQSGAHSFMAKPVDTADWQYRFGELINYWLQTVTLPKQPTV